MPADEAPRVGGPRLTAAERDKLHSYIRREDLRLYNERVPYRRLPQWVQLDTGLHVSVATVRRIVALMQLRGELRYYNGRQGALMLRRRWA